MLLFKFPSFLPQHGNTESVIDHAEQHAQAWDYEPNDDNQAQKLADMAARINCDEKYGYDDTDRKVYRGIWYHTVRTRDDWEEE